MAKQNLYLFFLLFLICGWAGGGYVWAEKAGENEKINGNQGAGPSPDKIWVDEQNGNFLPLDVPFTDENGNQVTLGEVIDKPTLVLPIYFYCPSSCSLNLVYLATAIKKSKFRLGRDFKAIAFSFNEEDGVEDAKTAKRNYIRVLSKDLPADQWKFLVGKEASIRAVTKSMGYEYIPQSDGTFIHPSAMIAVADDGKIIKYVYGKFIPGDVDLAISEARSGTPAKSIRRFLDYCFNYDPKKSRDFFQNLKLGVGVALLISIGAFVWFLVRFGKKRNSS